MEFLASKPIAGIMVDSLDYDDFSNNFCMNKRFPLTNLIKKHLNAINEGKAIEHKHTNYLETFDKDESELSGKDLVWIDFISLTTDKKIHQLLPLPLLLLLPLLPVQLLRLLQLPLPLAIPPLLLLLLLPPLLVQQQLVLHLLP